MTDSNPFWTFSLALYGRPGVADACLALQDEQGMDVNLLLYACYATVCGQALSEADLRAVDAAVREWRAEMVAPLRALRRRSEGDLKQRLSEAELLAEKSQQDMMWSSRSPGGDWPSPTACDDLLEENLVMIAAVAGVDQARLASLRARVSDALLDPGL